jgi:ATP-dependent DNA helicase RecG
MSMNFSDQELEQLLNDLESGRSERKEAFGDGKKSRAAVCAFANDLAGSNKPGVLFIGAKDNGQRTTDNQRSCP